MPRAAVSLQNFAAGELSPKLRGRYDLGIYTNGAERMQNFISEIQGPARYRAGFKFVTKTRHNLPARLIPFIYNEEQSYICEFTVGGIRFFANNGLVIESSTTNISGITQADPAVVTDTGHSFVTGQEIILSGIVGMTELNGNTYRVGTTATNTYELLTVEGDNVDSTGFTAYSSGGTTQLILSRTNPYTTITEIFDIDYAQSADTMYVVQRNHDPRKLIRTGSTTFTFNTYSRTADPFGGSNNPGAVNIYQQRIYMGGSTGQPLRFFASQAGNFDDFTTGSNDDDGFNFTIASKKISRINSISSNNKFLAILTDGGNRSVTGGNESAITPTNIKIDDIDFLGSADVFPLVKDNLIILVQQGKRKIRALSYSFEQDGYQPENLNATADHITESGIKEISYQEGSPDVVWSIREDGALLGLTLSKVDNVTGWHRHNTGGDDDKFYSANVIPRTTGYDQLWAVVERPLEGETKYYIEYLADDPFFPEFADYFTGENNRVADEEAFALAMYEAQKDGVYLDSSLTYDGSNQSVTMTPAAVSGASVVFTAGGSLFDSNDVGRQIWDRLGTGRAEIISYSSATQVTCKILKNFSSTNAIAAGDWYLTASTVSGLEHLEGRTVQIVTDGAVHPDRTVSSGSVSLDYQASVVHAGLKYTGLIVTNNIEGGGGNGPAQTKVKNIFKLGLRFNQTLGTEYGTSLYNLEKILFRNTSSFTNRPPPLFSGDRVFQVADSHSRSKKVYIRQNVPLPCSVQLLMIYLHTSED